MTLDELFDNADVLYQDAASETHTAGWSVTIQFALTYPNEYPQAPNFSDPPDQRLTYSPGRLVTTRQLTGGFESYFAPASFGGTFTAIDGSNVDTAPGAATQYASVSATIAAPRLVTWRTTSNPYYLYVSIPDYSSISIADPEVVAVGTGPILIYSGDGPSFTLGILEGSEVIGLPSPIIGETRIPGVDRG
jgi:hypothetical protein